VARRKVAGTRSETSRANTRNKASSLDQDKAAWLGMRRARRGAVVRFRRKALDAPDLESVLTEALEIATKILDVELAKVLKHDASHDNLIVRAAIGWPTDVTGHVIDHTQESSQAGYALLTGHAIVVEDLRRVDAFRGAQLLRENDVVSGATVIIHGQLTPWGVLSVHSTKRRMLIPDELDFLQAMADVIAAAAYRFRLARRREEFSVTSKRPSATVARH
jgi:GAF domain-containing protein